MAKKKKHIEPQSDQPILVIPRLHKLLEFPAGWDQHVLKDEQVDKLREYLREKTGAEEIQTTHHYGPAKIEGKPVSRQTALFFAQTVTAGELISEGETYPARKGQLIVLPAGADFRIKYTPQPREIIEFKF